MKKLISIFIACLMLFSFASCTNDRGGQDSSSKPTATPLPSAENTPLPHERTQADLDFEAIDLELFVSIVTSDGLTFHQYVKDPASFGIEEADIERGWGEFSYDANVESYEENRELLERLNAIDREQLSEMNKLAYDNLQLTLKASNNEEDYFYYYEPLTPLNGEHTTLPLMLALYEINTAEDVENYLLLLEDSPRYLDQIAQFETEKAQQGLFMTENALDKVVTSCREFADEGGSCFLINHFEKALSDNIEGVTDAQKEAYLKRGKDCVINELLPAYDSLADALDSLRDKCGDFTGASERGAAALEYYKLGMQSNGACMLDSSKITQILAKECDSAYMSMYAEVMHDVSALDDYDNEITSGSAESDVEYLLLLIKDIYPEIADQTIDYVTVPDAVAEDFSPAAYLISAYDDPSRNVVLLNPGTPGGDLLFTMAHECFPGHLYQTQYFRALPGLSLSQQLISPVGYTEGWAVFSELTMAGEAEKYGTSICKIKQYESIFGNILVPAYVSAKVNLDGWTKDDINGYLEKYGLNDSGYIDTIYEYAVDMPHYFYNYALGYTYMSLIYNAEQPDTVEETRNFFKKYLDMGPCWFDVLFEKFGIEP